MEKGQTIELKIEDMLDDGRAFGRYEGCAVFVSGGASISRAAAEVPDAGASLASGDGAYQPGMPAPAGTESAYALRRAAGAVPGDTVRAKVTKARKSSAEAMLTEIIGASADRISAECPFFSECGGCTLQELSYDAQRRLKTEQLRQKLERLGGIADPDVKEMIGAGALKYYRNKAVFAVGPHGEVGFMKEKSHSVVDITDCMLQTDAAMVCADALRTFLREYGQAGKKETGERGNSRKGRRNRNGKAQISRPAGIRQMTVRTAFATGEVMAVLECEEKNVPHIEELAELLDDAVCSLNPDISRGGELYPDGPADCTGDETEMFYSLESIALIHNGRCRIAAGKPTITDRFETPDGRTLSFEISPQSFYQVNPEQMVKLYDKAAEYAGIRAGKTILDLYCGAGTIGLWLLEYLRKYEAEAFENTRVIGIESVRPAVLDANRNSVINGFVNTRYICGKAEEELPGMMGLAELWKWNEVNERVKREPEVRIDKADCVILDPPRAGCDEALLDAVVKAGPERIVYVSCDPGTLARDIKYLNSNGYSFIECTPVDQFPWTRHVEVVARIQRNNP